MKKINEYWSKLKYWQMGGLIGLILGFFIPVLSLALSLLSEFFIGIFIISSIPIWLILPEIELLFNIPYRGHTPSLIIILLFEAILYPIVGVIIGYIIGKIKSK